MRVAAEVELLEARGWAEMHSVWAAATPSARARVQRWGRATALATPTLDVFAVNRVIGLGLEDPLDSSQIGEVSEFYRRAECTRWFLEWSPEARLAHPRVLEDAGAQLRNRGAKLFAEMGELRVLQWPGEVTVRPITADYRQVFADLVGQGLGIPKAGQSEVVAPIGLPGWLYYLAFVGGSVAAAAAMYVNDGGAWLGFTATREQFRGRGAQTALLSRRISDARALGCGWVSAETFPTSPDANPSLRNMMRFGMRVLYQRPWYRIDVPEEVHH